MLMLSADVWHQSKAPSLTFQHCFKCWTASQSHLLIYFPNNKTTQQLSCCISCCVCDGSAKEFLLSSTCKDFSCFSPVSCSQTELGLSGFKYSAFSTSKALQKMIFITYTVAWLVNVSALHTLKWLPRPGWQPGCYFEPTRWFQSDIKSIHQICFLPPQNISTILPSPSDSVAETFIRAFIPSHLDNSQQSRLESSAKPWIGSNMCRTQQPGVPPHLALAAHQPYRASPSTGSFSSPTIPSMPLPPQYPQSPDRCCINPGYYYYLNSYIPI